MLSLKRNRVAEVESEVRLATIVLQSSGDATLKYNDNALRDLERLCEQRVSLCAQAEASYWVGSCYLSNDGFMKPDVEKACHYLKKAADQPDYAESYANACALLGEMYYSGIGVSQDYVKAFDYGKKAYTQESSPDARQAAGYWLYKIYPFNGGNTKKALECLKSVRKETANPRFTRLITEAFDQLKEHEKK